MQVPKLVPQDSSTLQTLMHKKVKLGVIHPVHTPVIKEEVQDDFSDLQIIATQLNISSKSLKKKQIPEHLMHPEPIKANPTQLQKTAEASKQKNSENVVKTTQIQFEEPKSGRYEVVKTPKKEEKKGSSKNKNFGGQFRYKRGSSISARRREENSKKTQHASKSPNQSREEENSISEVFRGYYEKAKGLFNKLTNSPEKNNALPAKKLPKAAERYRRNSSSIIKEEQVTRPVSKQETISKPNSSKPSHSKEVSELDPELDDFIFSMNAKETRNQVQFATPEPARSDSIRPESAKPEVSFRDSRSELMKSKHVVFHPYMDPDGSVYNPNERFIQSTISPIPKEDEKEVHFVKEMMKRRPDESNPWFIRPHHLKSVTQHPLSVPDDPNYYIPTVKLPDRNEPQPPIDEREHALSYLEQALSDLKCELSERKKAAVYEAISETPDNKYNGWVAKVAETYT